MSQATLVAPKTFYISQSEVDSRLACERKHWYAFGKQHPKHPDTNGLQATHHSDSLTRGTVGHKVLEEYYDFIKQGVHRDAAFNQARAQHTVRLTKDLEHAEIYTEVTNYFTAYHDEYRNEDFEPLVMEHNFELRIDTDLVFPFTPDAIFREKSTGKIYVVDHKFLYRFYQDRVFPILPQMLRYAWALRQMGYEVHGYMYNMISTDKRAQPQNRFKRHKVDFTPQHERKMERVAKELVATMREIVTDKRSDPQVWDTQRSRRNMSSFTCANCPFLELCIAELEGQNGVDLMVSQFFESNKYGYGREESADV